MDGYTDDPKVSDEAVLWRCIPAWHFVFDKNRGRGRPKSAAFENHPDGTPMSILFADLVEQDGRGPRDAVAGHEDFGLAAITAGLARRCEQGVAHDPLPSEPAHGVVFGKKTYSVRKTFAKQAVWVIPPPDVKVPDSAT